MTLDRATLAARKRAYTYEPRLVNAVTALLRAEMRAGAARVKALDTLHITEGEVFPEAPDTRRVLLILEAVAESVAGPLLESARKRPKAPIVAAANPEPTPEDLLRVSFTASNPLVRRLLDEFGLQITQVTDGERRRIVEAARLAYAEGLSIPHAAAAIMETVAATEVRATMIARTMLVGAANGASLAAVRMAGAAPFKSWLATIDSRCRPEHLAANGQTVPIDKSFQVGGYALHYPGDPNGPADMVVNCRCTVTYADSPLGTPGINSAPLVPALAAAGGTLPAVDSAPNHDAALLPPNHDYIGRGGPCVMCGLMPDAPAHSPSGMAAERDVAALDGTGWQAALALEGVFTDDNRMWTIGALAWREPPLTLYAQFENAQGHEDAPIAGRIDTISRVSRGDSAVIAGRGVFDSAEPGQMAARLVADRTLNGISIDFATHEAEVIDGPLGPDGEPGPGQLIISSATILAATLVGMPAFADASISLTADASGGTLIAPFLPTLIYHDNVSADVAAASAALDRATLPDRITAAAGLIDRHVITEAEARAMIGLDGDAPDVPVAPPQTDAIAALAASLDGRFEPLVAALERVANQPPPQLPAITLTLPAEPARRIVRTLDRKQREAAV